MIVVGGGTFLSLAFVLFLPGYVVVAALFPGDKRIDWLERIALSFGLSLAIVPLLGLFLSFTPLGLRFTPILGTMAAFVLSVCLIAYWRRMRLAPQDLVQRIPSHVPVDQNDSLACLGQ